MSDWTYDRAAALGGVAFVVLAGAASVIAPTTLALDSGVDEVRDSLAGHADALGASALLTAYHVGGFDDPSLLLTFRLWQMVSYNLSALPAAVVMLLAGVRTLQTGVFPRWLGATAIVAAVAGLGAVSILYITGEHAPTLLDTGAFALASLWIAATGILAAARPVPAATVSTTVA